MNTDKQQQEIWNEIGAREDWQLFIKGDMTRGWLEEERYRESGKKDAEEIFNRLKEGGVDLYGKRVLEIGCGGGRMTSEFKKLGVKMEGIDISKSLIGKLKKNNRKIQTYIGYNLKSIPNNYYDAILSFMTFQHCNKESVIRYFKQGLDKLKDGGYFVFQLPVKGETSEITTPFVDYTRGYIDETHLFDGIKLRHWDFSELEELKEGYKELFGFTAFIDASVFVFQKE
ncbi:MAG: bifunctional 3-demethylubiquinone-9 3-methyltransferase/ 2-octaprenyl-6-hydroxy phenol methylase [Methanobacterium sp. PtaU1.Bin242]|nr:MAG: bifunctional 3-demethylubiquinone-9 3-methyltransferase/ 2-octaprenyl-6-hydroxy phenol methylase [Methanobacterium sp. PtaU1.Bin242]